jgi:anti-sigma regulatory factor (Ser/Thr protein kinase)
MPAPTTASTTMQLVLPPDPQLLRIVRLVASGLASLGSLDLDAVEEVRVAADELVSTMMEASDGAPVTVELSIDATAMSVEASTRVTGELDIDPMTDLILEQVSTRHEWRSTDGEAHGFVERALP